MELSKQIKKYRVEQKLSQEELAERIYVTRQTVSNWENEKSYPDIHSILLLSSLFAVSLDQLIKGDLSAMEEKIKEIKAEDVKNFNRWGGVLTVFMTALVLAFAPLLYFGGVYGIAVIAGLFAITVGVAVKVEKYKKANDIQTYQEIIAFSKGEALDEISRNREQIKRPYQKALLVLGSGAVTAAVGILILMLIQWLK